MWPCILESVSPYSLNSPRVCQLAYTLCVTEVLEWPIMALTAQSYAVELRLALKGAARRGGYFDPENVPYALEAMPVIEAALQHYCDMLRADRGALREGKGNRDLRNRNTVSGV